VTAALNRDGIACSVGLVADLMREVGLRACQPRAYKRTTLPSQAPVESPDLIGRKFTATRPGTRLVGDITYLRTGEGWLYLATVIDLATRMVIGWQTADHSAPASSLTPWRWPNDTAMSAPERCSTATISRASSMSHAVKVNRAQL
jgi:transposase InsO family protein